MVVFLTFLLARMSANLKIPPLSFLGEKFSYAYASRIVRILKKRKERNDAQQ